MCNWISIPGSQSRGRVSDWGSSSLIYQAQPVLPTTFGGRLQGGDNLTRGTCTNRSLNSSP
jgi:hypothetical protein